MYNTHKFIMLKSHFAGSDYLPLTSLKTVLKIHMFTDKVTKSDASHHHPLKRNSNKLLQDGKGLLLYVHHEMGIKLVWSCLSIQNNVASVSFSQS